MREEKLGIQEWAKKEMNKLERKKEKNKKVNTFAKKREVESVLLPIERILVLMYKVFYFTTNLHSSFPW